MIIRRIQGLLLLPTRIDHKPEPILVHLTFYPNLFIRQPNPVITCRFVRDEGRTVGRELS